MWFWSTLEKKRSLSLGTQRVSIHARLAAVTRREAVDDAAHLHQRIGTEPRAAVLIGGAALHELRARQLEVVVVGSQRVGARVDDADDAHGIGLGRVELQIALRPEAATFRL